MTYTKIVLHPECNSAMHEVLNIKCKKEVSLIWVLSDHLRLQLYLSKLNVRYFQIKEEQDNIQLLIYGNNFCLHGDLNSKTFQKPVLVLVFNCTFIVMTWHLLFYQLYGYHYIYMIVYGYIGVSVCLKYHLMII